MIKILLLFTLFHLMIVNLEIAKIEHPIFHTLMISPSLNLLILLHFISFAFFTVLLGGTQSCSIYRTAALLIVMCLVLLSCILCARIHGRIFHLLIFTAFEIRNSIKVGKKILFWKFLFFYEIFHVLPELIRSYIRFIFLVNISMLVYFVISCILNICSVCVYCYIFILFVIKY